MLRQDEQITVADSGGGLLIEEIVKTFLISPNNAIIRRNPPCSNGRIPPRRILLFDLEFDELEINKPLTTSGATRSTGSPLDLFCYVLPEISRTGLLHYGQRT
jgi:hypothetical protein